MVVFGVSPTFCDVASQRTTCRFESDAAVLTFRRQPALPLLASLGIVPRVFGHNCVPVHASSTERLQSLAPVTCEHPADLRRSRIGPGPVDTPAAEAAVRRAFTDMLDVGDGNRSLPSVELGTGLPVARRLAGASGLAPPEVRRVDFVDEREAVVTFGSGTRLPTGEAVVQDGQWKVAQPTFCALLREKGLSCFS